MVINRRIKTMSLWVGTSSSQIKYYRSYAEYFYNSIGAWTASGTNTYLSLSPGEFSDSNALVINNNGQSSGGDPKKAFVTIPLFASNYLVLIKFKTANNNSQTWTLKVNNSTISSYSANTSWSTSTPTFSATIDGDYTFSIESPADGSTLNTIFIDTFIIDVNAMIGGGR